MNRIELGKKTSLISVIINIILCIFKLAAGILGNSKAMIADGIHTLSDVLATFVVYLGLRISYKEADENHPYGHEKYEPVFTKIVSVILVITGFLIGYESIISLTKGNIKMPGKIALIAALISIVVKEGMYWYTIKIAKKIKSISLEADAWHHRSDAFSSLGTFAGILGARMGLVILDPIAGIIVSILILKVGVEFYMKAIKQLVDEAADEDTIEKIKELTHSLEGVKGIKTLKTRVFGNRLYVDIDVLVDGTLSVEEGHDIAENIHDSIESNIEDVKHCMVHIEPIEND
ncbi:MAG TPA: cation diffusion facilitator family transporter [Tissierellales bacterium]|nr:cation diffusion facilitator family transporter [Tissierellales bacterium]